jgi:Uncharacterised nucleotidyltransferase
VALSGELQLAELLKKHEIAVAPLKGPVLRQKLYADLSRRSSADLDWLVHPLDVLLVRDVRRTKGYRVLPQPGSLRYPSVEIAVAPKMVTHALPGGGSFLNRQTCNFTVISP